MSFKYLCLMAPVALAQIINYNAASLSISAEMADPSFVPYVKPAQKVEEFIALGDSYTAGTGCNGIPEVMAGSAVRGKRAYPMQMSVDEDNWAFINDGDGTLPRFSFHAYTGDKVEQLVSQQLKKGDYKDDKNLPRNQPFGKPQVAVLTIGGNDARLGDILNDCIYLAWKPKNCDETLASVQREIDNGALQDKINYAMYQAAHAGRAAGGTVPAQSFQVYVLEYLTFFDDAMSPECNSYSWASWSWGAQPKLDVALRTKLNDMTRKVNAVIKAAATELERMGVIYVEGIQDTYRGHRYCEPGANKEQTAFKVWFWSPYAHSQTTSEGPGDPNVADTAGNYNNPAQQLLNFVFPGQSLAQNNTPPWEWVGAEKYPDFQSLMAAISEATNDDPATQADPPFQLQRSFHPKGTAYGEHSRALFAALADNRATAAGGGSTGGQQIAIASYTNPLGDPAAWQRLISYDSNKVSILVANVLNGPDYKVDTSWSSVIQQAASSGKTVIGYVRTGYLGQAYNWKTRLGSNNLADWISQIEQDVDKWYELYPGGISGIFFDEGWPECGPNNIYSNLYAHVNAYTKRKHPGAYTVLNPGSPMDQCFEDTMDTLLTFESSYETYTSSAFTPNTWKPKDNRKIWHIVYRVPQDKIAEVAALSASRGVGYLEMTDDDNPNPYDNVPNDAYMAAAMSAVSGGKVLKAAAPALGGSYVAGLPSDSQVIASDYTSATITWSPVPNALGYAVYQNGMLVLEVPPFLTRATVGMIEPGTSGISFEVKTVLSSGGGGASRSITASTKSLPSGGSISNVSYRKDGNMVIYNADVLVPYAFVRLFIGGPHKAVGASAGWPIDAGLSTENGGGDPVAQFKLVNYLVEGNDFYSGFYKYSGAYVEGGSSNADWTWSPQGTAPQSQSGYTYTWNVPLGGTDALPDDYVVQGQGYAPVKNAFGGSLRSYKCGGEPCDDNPDYDCKGSTLCTTPDLLKWCDLAINNLTRTDTFMYSTSGDGPNGGCHGDGTRFCGVFLQGTGCSMSGNDMWNTYQDLRKLGGCSKCGSYHQENGCLFTVNYVSHCDDGPQQPGGPF